MLEQFMKIKSGKTAFIFKGLFIAVKRLLEELKTNTHQFIIKIGEI
jgi:hypothetical protein